MASTVIHMCVAKKINEQINYPSKMLLLGTIAPDLSKHVGENKVKSHFLNNFEEIEIDRFLNKYGSMITDPFIMGYFIHLYTDILWKKCFIRDFVNEKVITLMNGEEVLNNDENYKKLIYNDYTNLNIQLLDLYDLDLSLFYSELELPNIKMDEIPIDKLKLLVDYTSVVIAKTKEKKAYTFDIKNVNKFIETASELITAKIKEILTK